MTKRKSALNSGASPRKATGKPFVKGDPRINLKGAPKRGMSWKEAYQWAYSLNAEDMAAILEASGRNDLSEMFRRMPKGIELKSLQAARIVAANMFEPDARLLNAVMDRDEGKVKQEIEINDWRTEAKQQGYDPDRLFADMVAAARARMDGASSSGSVAGSAAGTATADGDQ